MDYMERYRRWANGEGFDAATRGELAAIAGIPKEIEDRFYQDLQFGTAGLRGIIGAGTNRMNVYTVRKATQGVAQDVLSRNYPPGVSGAVIARDTRRMSWEFAREAACVLAANGIRTGIFGEITPTPVLSFAVRHLACAAGIVITASHNPKEYNGYKVYDMLGGQITDRHALAVSEYISRIDPIRDIRTMDFDEAVRNGLIRILGDEVLDAYEARVLRLLGDTPAEARGNLKVVYTPLNGAGFVPVTRILERAGFRGVRVVPDQRNPDQDFRSVSSPNPEDPEALGKAIGLATESDADLVIATDPDGDRMGAAYRNHEGGYYLLTGNQAGCLLMESVLRRLSRADGMSADDYVVKSVVTTEMVRAIAARYGIRVVESLTGFKYIADAIERNSLAGKGRFLFGFEESYGYLAGDFVRDKDAVIASMLLCEMAAEAKWEGKTPGDLLREMFERYGHYRDGVISHVCPGVNGLEAMRVLMDRLREQPPESAGGLGVTAVRDYKRLTRRTFSGIVERLDMPPSDLLYFELEGGAWLAVRPSGTEPKIKFYTGVCSETEEKSAALSLALTEEIERILRNDGNAGSAGCSPS